MLQRNKVCLGTNWSYHVVTGDTGDNNWSINHIQQEIRNWMVQQLWQQKELPTHELSTSSTHLLKWGGGEKAMTPFTFASGNSFLCSCSRSSALAGELPRWSQHLARASLPTTNTSSNPFKSLASNARARHCSRCVLRFCHAISNSLRRSWRFSSQCSTWETAKRRGKISEFWIRHIKITILEVLLFHSTLNSQF